MTELVNAAHRGNTGSGRWTAENGLIAGTRTDTERLADLIVGRHTRVFAAFDDNDCPRSCIVVQLKATDAEISDWSHPGILLL